MYRSPTEGIAGMLRFTFTPPCNPGPGNTRTPFSFHRHLGRGEGTGLGCFALSEVSCMPQMWYSPLLGSQGAL